MFRRYTDSKVLLGLEAEARAAKRGLWSLPAKERVPPWEWRERERGSRAPAAAPQPAAALEANAFACGKTRCGEMESCAEARFHLVECGTTRLDGDGDGIPCEALCL